MTVGIILAGGRAHRMGGGDKGFSIVDGRPILDRIVATLRAQCRAIVISANGDPHRFARYGCPVIADLAPTPQGPLGGVLAAMTAVAARHSDAGDVLTVPTDTPFLPTDLVGRLADARDTSGAPLVCARSGGRVHPVVALWSLALRHDLRVALEIDGLRKVGGFAERHPHAFADWPATPDDPFFNVNTPADLATAAAIARRVEPG